MKHLIDQPPFKLTINQVQFFLQKALKDLINDFLNISYKKTNDRFLKNNEIPFHYRKATKKKS